MDLCEFEASLVYRVSSRTDAKARQRNPVLKNKTKQNKHKTPPPPPTKTRHHEVWMHTLLIPAPRR